MAESSMVLMKKSRDLLATPNHEPLSLIINHIFTHQDSNEHETYDFCLTNFPNCLTLTLLKIYRYSSSNNTRYQSISLLSTHKVNLSEIALNEIKPLLVSCLLVPHATESDTKILSRIVSCVANSVGMYNKGVWNELGDCILSLTRTDLIRAFNLFVKLPPVSVEFINRFRLSLVEEVYKFLFSNEDDWSLGLVTAFKLGFHVLEVEFRREVLGVVLKSADELVMKGKEWVLELGLERLVKFLSKECSLFEWSVSQCGFVAEFAYRVAGIGMYTKEAAKKMYQMVLQFDNDPAFKLSPCLVDVQRDEIEVYNNLNFLSAVEVMSMVAKSQMDDKSREIAVRRVHDLLCGYTSGIEEIDVSEMRELKRLLISCIREEGVPWNTFKILGKVVFHVANEMFCFQEDMWPELWEFLGSECEREFKKTVYIFQCLTMMVDDKRFVIRAIERLVAEISVRLLNPPREMLVDNSYWVLAFVGGFCAGIHLLDVTDHAGSVKEIIDKMVQSVRELVEKGMEVGVVRRAFRDMESIVKKGCDWYDISEYEFVKALLWKLYDIKGMEMESKIVLWRINVILEKGTKNVVKNLT